MENLHRYGLITAAAVLVVAGIAGFVGSTDIRLDAHPTLVSEVPYEAVFPGEAQCTDPYYPPSYTQSVNLQKVTVTNQLPIPRVYELPRYMTCFTPVTPNTSQYATGQEAQWFDANTRKLVGEPYRAEYVVELSAFEQRVFEYRVPVQCPATYKPRPEGESRQTFIQPGFTAALLVEAQEASYQQRGLNWCTDVTEQQKTSAVTVRLE